MTLRAKLWLAQAPLLLALAIVGGVGVAIIGSLGESSGDILADNYRSVLAAERMKEYVERIDSAALFIVAGERERGQEQVEAFRGRFAQELEFQESNITEAGETEATAALRRSWHEYEQALIRFAAHPDAASLRPAYFAEVLPRFTAVKDAADAILSMNQDAMVKKSEAAARAARRFNAILVAIAILGFALGLWASSRITSRLLRPLSVLSHATRSIGEGDLRTSVPIYGHDEIARVAAEFNAMTERLRRYRESSLGELLIAQNAAQAAIDSLPDPILILSLEGHLLHANQAARGLWVPEAAPPEDPVAAMDPPLRARLRAIQHHVLGGKGAYVPAGLDEAVRAGGGSERFVLPRGTPLYRDEGDVAGTTIVLQDVTRLLRFQQLKDDLVATVAHEFRTPLTSLRMAIHLCVEQTVGPLTEKQADLLHAAREDCERLQGIVEEVLDLSRLREGRTELRRQGVDVESLVRSALHRHAGTALRRGVHLKNGVLPGAGSVLADPERLGLVLSNLLVNAIRHSPEGAEVTVRSSVDAGQIRIEVLDRGPGVPAEQRDAIFEKHVRGPAEPDGGSGLGLFIAREIVTAHGGAIGVSEREGGGSAFWVSLPSAA